MLTNCNECEKFIEKINWYRNEMLEMSKKLQAAQALAATHLTDQELLMARERKRVARECAEICANIANGYGGHASWAADTIRDRYGVD